MKNKGYVYLISDTNNDGCYKIGTTKGKIENRIKQLQTGNPGEIYVCNYYETYYPYFIERRLHIKYADSNVKNEWFEIPVEDTVNFKDICEKEEKQVEILKDNPFFKKYMR